MEPKLTAVASSLVVGLIVIGAQIPGVATTQVRAGPSQLARLPDGGPVYVAPYFVDGGVQWLRVAASEVGCVRAPVGGSQLLCRRGPNTLSNVYYGELNRFPANEAQPLVNNCETIACGVISGEDPDEDEATLLDSVLGIVLP